MPGGFRILPPLPPAARAEEYPPEEGSEAECLAETFQNTDLQALITQQYDAFVRSLNAKGASEGVSQLITNSVMGRGNMKLGKNDEFTKTLLNSALLRDGFIRIAARCIDKLQKDAAQVMFMKGCFCRYDHGTYYNCYTYKMNAAGTEPTDTKVYPSIQVKHNDFTEMNNFDDGLMLVAGDTLGQFTCRRISADANQVVFRIDVKISDTFDFYGSNHSGSKEPSVRHAYRGFFFERKIIF